VIAKRHFSWTLDSEEHLIGFIDDSAGFLRFFRDDPYIPTATNTMPQPVRWFELASNFDIVAFGCGPATYQSAVDH